MLSQPVVCEPTKDGVWAKGTGNSCGNVAGLLGVVDEGIQVVTDDFRHAGGGDGDHVRLVDRLGVFQAVDHVLLTAEHGGIFRHRVGHAGARFLEVTVEVGAEVGDTALRTMHVGQGLVEAGGAEDGAERLAGLGRVDGQGFALEVEVLVFLGGGPHEGFPDFFRAMAFFEEHALLGEVLLVVVITEQRITGLDVVCGLHCDLLARTAHLRLRA